MTFDNEKAHAEHSVQYGSSPIAFRMEYAKRKTLALHVHPDCSVSVTAPTGVSVEKVKDKILKRAKWIRKQQKLFGRLPPVLPARKYISGESFRYLGRQHTLKVKRDIANHITIDRLHLFVHSTSLQPHRVKELVAAWYNNRAEIIFQSRLEACLVLAKKVGISYDKKIIIRVMKSRWGSCSKEGKITLNLNLVCATKDCIDYVILHELCHLKAYNHGAAFYKLLNLLLPDWKKRKEKLDTSMELRVL